MPKRNNQQLADSLPLVAIELGSQSVRAMAAEKTSSNQLHILGYEEQHIKRKYTSHGVVEQTTEIGYTINLVLKLLANRIQVEALPAAVTLLGGETMQIIDIESSIDLARKQPINDTVLDQLENICTQKIVLHNPQATVLELVPSYFILDGVKQNNIPTEQQRAKKITGHYTAFVGKQELVEKVRSSFHHAIIVLEKTFVRPDALLSAFLFGEQEMANEGCAVLDLGAETTTLSVFKQNTYIDTKVIAKGGQDITDALAAAGHISPQTAEQLKCQCGWAAPEYVEKNSNVHLSQPKLNEEWNTNLTEIATIIRPVVDETITPLMDVLNQYSGHIKRLYITGGGSLLPGLIDYISTKTTVDVQYGAHWQLLDDATPDEFCSPRYSSLIGGLILCSDYRDAHPGQILKRPNRIDLINTSILEFFQ
ncbi:MAG: rod shape-determining protein [Paludibacteraceae bacterium]|nr:rod shape-determining protein [Paludibacteraceae bacterium]